MDAPIMEDQQKLLNENFKIEDGQAKLNEILEPSYLTKKNDRTFNNFEDEVNVIINKSEMTYDEKKNEIQRLLTEINDKARDNETKIRLKNDKVYFGGKK